MIWDISSKFVLKKLLMLVGEETMKQIFFIFVKMSNQFLFYHMAHIGLYIETFHLFLIKGSHSK